MSDDSPHSSNVLASQGRGIRGELSPVTSEYEPQARKAVLGALVGTSLEWYDFSIFGTATALIFNHLFFVGDDPTTAVLASFATLAVGFVARPLGGIIFGWMGDRIGRKTTLLITITLIGAITGIIGLLPTAESIGLWAPTSLVILRFVQGLALGGEWGGAIVLTAESAPPHRRVLYAAIPLIGAPIGTLLSSGAFLAAQQLSQESMLSWGWRIPFLAAFPMLLFALFVRSRLEESPAFEKVLVADRRDSAPLFDVIRYRWKQVLVGALACTIGMGGFYLVTTFVINYADRILGVSSKITLIGTLWAAAAEIVIIIVGGLLAHRFGPVRIGVGGGLLCIIAAFPIFYTLHSKNTVTIWFVMALGVLLLSTPYSVLGTVMSSLFETPFRYSGVALCANLSAIFSGFIPMLAAYLLAAANNGIWTAALVFIGMAVMTIFGFALAPRMQRVGLPLNKPQLDNPSIATTRSSAYDNDHHR